MNEINKKIIMDEIKGLMNGISYIVNNSSMSVVPINYSNNTINVTSVSELNNKTNTIKAYVAKIEEKTKLLEESLAAETTIEVDESTTTSDTETNE